MEIPTNPDLNLLVVALVSIVGSWVYSYFRERAKNTALKEDIQAITQKIESVKAELGSQLYVHQFRYQKEFEILQELAEVSSELRGASQQLPPVGPSVETIGEDPDNKKKRRLERYWKAMQEFVRITEIRKPFFPDEIYKLLLRLENTSLGRALDYQDLDPNDDSLIEVFRNDAKDIDQVSQDISEAIRQRVKKWEPLFPEEQEGKLDVR